MENPLDLLPLAASICVITALIQAWIMTAIRYFNLTSIKRLFPNYRDLVRSHVDFLMMASLVFSMYLVINHLSVSLPGFISVLIFIGALYNPFGFFLQAIKPDIAESGGVYTKAGLIVGFMPLTIGLTWAAACIILAIIN